MSSYKVVDAPQERKRISARGLFTTPSIWMGEKAKRDQTLWKAQNEGLWIIENKLYDLKDFAARHPGGASWITLTQGQDVTEHFIIHHLRESKARQILNKYYVKDAEKEVRRFTFEQDGFYRTVKRRVLEKYTPEEIQNENKSKIYAVTILMLWILCLVAILVTKSIVPAVLAALPMVGLVGIGHNFVHHKESIFRYFFSFGGFTQSQWQMMHCLSHHIYPNTELDYEIAAFEPLGYYLRTLPENTLIKVIIVEIALIFIQPINMLLKLVIYPLRKFRMPDLWYGFPLILVGIFYFWFGNMGEALKFYFVMYGAFGFIMMKSLFCGHRLRELWTEGAEKIEDFGQHTMMATSDTDTWIGGIFSYMLLAGFNVHLAHHFFPTADHHILPKIREIIIQVAQEKSLKYTQTTRIQCYKSLYKGFFKRIPYINKH